MNRWLLLFLLALTGLRLFMTGQSELSPDETYYYQWSQRPDWAYYSKGPGVAVAIRAGTALFGPTEFGVRFLSPLFALGTSLILFAFARRLYSESVAVWTVIFLNLTPIFQAGSLVMTIDALSIFFWAAALWTFWLALERSPAFSWYWPLTGLFMGLGFLAKYTNTMELLSVVLVLGLTPKFRGEFKRPGFWVMLGLFVLAVIPPVLWNAQHEWATLGHLRNRGSLEGHFSFHPEEALVFLGLHFGVYSPLIFAAMVVALWQGCREARIHFKPRFLVLFSLPLIIMYCALSLKKSGQANWTAPAFVSLGILTAALWHDYAQRKAWARRFAVAALAIGLLMSLLVVNTDVARRLGIPLAYEKDPSSRMRGWESVSIEVNALRHRIEQETGKPLFLIANKSQTASSLAFYLPEKRVEGPGHPPVYIPESQAIENQYSFWPRYDEMIEPASLARLLLPGVSDPAKHDALASALKEAGKIPPTEESTRASEKRRALIKALLAVNPDLPLDEFGSEELGVSLFHGRDALYISDSGGNAVPTGIQNGFERVEMIALWEESRRGLPLRVVRVYTCHNYRSLPL